MTIKCKTCAGFHKVYSEFAFGYSPIITAFYCAFCDKITEKDGVCDNWRKKGKAEVDFSKERFDEVERDIRFIKNNYKKLK